MKEATAFFKKNPHVEMIEAFVVDVNGVLRGKWVPRRSIKKITNDGMRIPLSAFAPDIWGNNVEATGLITETGDNDGVCHMLPEHLTLVPWLKQPTAQAMMTMDFGGDPRCILANVLAQYKKAGLTPVVAAELEFYLLDAKREKNGAPQPPIRPHSGRRAVEAHTYNLAEADEFRKTLADIVRFCHAQNVPADTTISENGPGQYEINLHHVPNALLAADHAVLLKRVVKSVAARDGLSATFMAKPYFDKAGSGLHFHFSILDRKGHNIFAGKDATGSPALKYAVGGVLATMADSTAIFAPHANSFRRFKPGSGAPTTLSWGYDNRSTAIRIPESDLKSTRIEHRVCGADVNPYIALAVILGGALEGITKKTNPPPATKGEAIRKKSLQLPHDWGTALRKFEHSAFIDRALGKTGRRIFLGVKRQEKKLIAKMGRSAEHDTYLRDV
jgi:glutamine synthetase